MSSSCLFTYFHVLLLFMVLNIHHINLNLYDIPLIIFLWFFFFFLLAVSWFLLPVFQHFWSSLNFTFLCLDTFAHLLSNFKCLFIIRLNLQKNIWWWQLGRKEGRTPLSTTKLGLSVKMRSMQGNEFGNKWVGSDINGLVLILILSLNNFFKRINAILDNHVSLREVTKRN